MTHAIKIIHTWNQIKEYRFLSDYFRMMGIYICGYTPQTDCLQCIAKAKFVALCYQ